MEAQDKVKLKELVDRRGDKGKPLMRLSGPGSPDLWCEAAASAKQLGMEKVSERFWAKAMQHAPLSKCIKNNWPLMHPDTTFEGSHSSWDLVRYVYRTGVPHSVGSHHGPAVRYTEARRFALSPT